MYRIRLAHIYKVFISFAQRPKVRRVGAKVQLPARPPAERHRALSYKMLQSDIFLPPACSSTDSGTCVNELWGQVGV